MTSKLQKSTITRRDGYNFILRESNDQELQEGMVKWSFLAANPYVPIKIEQLNAVNHLDTSLSSLGSSIQYDKLE